SDEYEKWAKPVLDGHKLTFEEKFELDRDKGDKKDVYKDVTALATATDADSIAVRHKLATDVNYREQILGQLPKDQRELAEKIVKQSDLLPPELAKLTTQDGASAHPGAKTEVLVEKGAAPQGPPQEAPVDKAQVVQRLKTDEAYRNTVLAGMDAEQQRQ